MSNFYEQLCESFIKPSRQTYHRHDLGQAVSANGRRTDFQMTNTRNLKLICSYYANNTDPAAPCLVYLHGFNGSRLESLVYVDRVLATGINMCSFDFAGTGLSEGEYVSLGAHQQFDVLDVLQYVSQHFGMTKFILWGRSMGAAAAIKFASLMFSNRKKQNPKPHPNFQLVSLILDSPFYSLNELSVEIAKSKVKVPQILIKAVLALVRSTIESKASFSMDQLQLLPDASFIKCPVLLIASKDDQLIHYSHTDRIYKAILHKDKEILFIKGEHYDMREDKVIQYILKFADTTIKRTEKLKKQNNFVGSSKLIRDYQHLERSYEVKKPQASNEINKKNYLHNSLDTASPIHNEQPERMKTDGSVDFYEQRPYIYELLQSKKPKTPLNNSKIKEEQEKIANRYKKPYFNIQAQFATPNKLKLKSKKHIQSQQALETKHFFSDKKIQDEVNDLEEVKNKMISPSRPIANVKRIKESSIKKIESNHIVIKEFEEGKQTKRTEKIRLMNPNIRILSSSVEYLDAKTAEENSPRSKFPQQVQVNHLNVISTKLKKNKKSKASGLSKEGEQVIRQNSVSIDTKWLLNTKKPPNLNPPLKISQAGALHSSKTYLGQGHLHCK